MSKHTKRHRVEAFARRMINKHLAGKGWTFAWDRAVRRLGCCHYGSKRITLSKPFLERQTYQEQCDTIMHEIAHALTPGDHHGKRWQAQMIAFGLSPDVSAAVDSKPPHSWELVDTTTGKVLDTFYRRPRRDFATYFVKGRQEETLGKLKVRRA